MTKLNLSSWSQFDPQFAALDLQVTGIKSDSRQIQAGDLFIALKGQQFDALDFLSQVQQQGAVCVLTNSDKQISSDIPIIYSPNLTQWLAQAVHTFYQAPHCLVGVTGTNGKTSVTHYIAQAQQRLQRKYAVIGTAGNGDHAQLMSSKNTTPDLVSFYDLLRQFSTEFDGCAIEVSSHGIALKRIGKVDFNYKIFTNITQDHLDFHGSFADYYAVKKDWFLQGTGCKIINIDDKELAQLYHDQHKEKWLSYSINKKDAHIFASNIKQKLAYMQFDLHINQQTVTGITLPLLGEFNLSNALACATLMAAQQYPIKTIVEALAGLTAVSGRMQFKQIKQRVIVVDYAHTEDALAKALSALVQKQPKAVNLVFGCGGDRDQGKRALMAKVAQQFCSKVYVTNDNPRTEQPQQIFADIQQGFSAEFLQQQVQIISDRQQAIKQAMSQLQAEEILLIAGKGHETYQEINHQRVHFSDMEMLNKHQGEIK